MRDTLFDSAPKENGNAGPTWSWDSYGTDDFYPSGSDDEDSYRYYYLDYRYDYLIDDRYDARVTEPEKPGANPVAAEFENQFFTTAQAALAPARPSTAVLTTRPYTTDGPLFVEFRKAAIIHLQSARSLRRDLLETAVALAAQGRLTVASKGSELLWEDRKEDGHSWRQLSLPMLGWEICYAIDDGELIVANSAELLKSVLDSSANKHALPNPSDATDDLTIVRFDQRKSAFDDIMKSLDKDGIEQRTAGATEISETFFSGNIGSLLDVASDVSRVEITRRTSSDSIHEEIHFVLNSK
jgi:hypothetical protein